MSQNVVTPEDERLNEVLQLLEHYENFGDIGDNRTSSGQKFENREKIKKFIVERCDLSTTNKYNQKTYDSVAAISRAIKFTLTMRER